MSIPARVAICHDWLDTWGGAENVLVELLAAFPGADLFTLVDFMPSEARRRLGPIPARTSWLQHLPRGSDWFRYCLPLMPAAVERFDFSAYDLILSSSHAVAKGARTRDDQIHICYCHTPARYVWEQRDHSVPARGLRGTVARRVLDRLQAWDKASADGVDQFIANSAHIAARIARCYGRQATVIHPPVDVSRFAERRDSIARDDYYVTVSRLVPYKRVDLLIDAFHVLPQRRLVVIGDGPEAVALARRAPANVTFRGRVDGAELVALVQNARAFVFAAEEDFGITLVEAQAAGTPVIAYAGGAARETVRGLDAATPTGVLFEAQSAAAIVAAIREFESMADRIAGEACQTNAARFAPEKFRAAIAEFVATVCAARDTLGHVAPRASA